MTVAVSSGQTEQDAIHILSIEGASRTCFQNVDLYCEYGDKDQMNNLKCCVVYCFRGNVQLCSIWVCVFTYTDDAVIFHFTFYFFNLKFNIVHLEGKRLVGMPTDLMLLIF